MDAGDEGGASDVEQGLGQFGVGLRRWGIVVFTVCFRCPLVCLRIA